MIHYETYPYELWDGKQVIGKVYLPYKVWGTSVAISFAPSILKQEYGKKYEKIVCPIAVRQVSDDGPTIVFKRYLDVRKKSQRQRQLLMAWAPY